MPIRSHAQPGLHIPNCCIRLLASCLFSRRKYLYAGIPLAGLLASLFSLSCNQTFQPEVNYKPRLNVYAVLFANAEVAYVRVMSVVESPTDVSEPVHGASVKLTRMLDGYSLSLVDTTEVIDGDTASFYYTPVRIFPGTFYSVSVEKSGYPPVTANVTVPFGYATVPEQGVYSAFRDPEYASSNLGVEAILSGLASAAFVQVLVEYRGLDSAGSFCVGAFNVMPIDSVNPFTEIEAAKLPVSVNISQYKDAFALAKQATSRLKVSHMYVDIIVTQVNDNLYRFFVTSMRSLNPLSMRTDKIIFTNIFNKAGTGIVSGASIDTTRIFLF